MKHIFQSKFRKHKASLIKKPTCCCCCCRSSFCCLVTRVPVGLLVYLTTLAGLLDADDADDADDDGVDEEETLALL